MIPVNEPIFIGREKYYLQQCIDTGWISSEGPFVKKFEVAFSKSVGCNYGIAVSNGSAAIEVALAALNVGPGDEVIIPSFTIISCVLAVIRLGAKPVLVDCDPLTWNMDVNQVSDKLTEKTKVIMAVHIYGLPVDIDPLLLLAEEKGIYVIEDSAEAHGLHYKGRACGSMGVIGTFSFYANKLITTGEGGMVVTNDAELAERCRSLRNLCFRKDRRFVHDEMGWNYRLTNLQAAIGLAQMEHIDEFIAIKRRNGSLYTKLLSNVESLQLPLDRTQHSENIYWVYGVVIRDDVPLDAKIVMDRLAASGIGTRPFFWPMHEQPVFKKMGLFNNQAFPVAEKIARRGFYLPSGLALTSQQSETVVSALEEAIK